MDISEAIEAVKLTKEQFDYAEKYFSARTEAGVLKSELDVLLASKYLSDFRSTKKNLGYEMALLMMIEKDETARESYSKFIRKESEYKALEKIIDAYQSRISFIQSILKYQIKGEGNG